MQSSVRAAPIRRILLLVAGALGITLTIGFYWQLPSATNLWPWPDSHLSYVWLASICAAIAAPIIWIAFTGELGASVGGAINLLVTAIAVTIFLLISYNFSSEPALISFTIFFAVSIPILAGLTWLFSRSPIHDSRPMPRLVFFSFIVFILLLLFTSIALILRAPTIFPWSLMSESSVIFGCFFLGAACYFAYGLVRPSWHNACGQLLGFLAYDIVLIVPFVAHFANVTPAHLPSLIIYVAVLIYSGALAIYYLFIKRSTRLWAGASQRQESMAAGL